MKWILNYDKNTLDYRDLVLRTSFSRHGLGLLWQRIGKEFCFVRYCSDLIGQLPVLLKFSGGERVAKFYGDLMDHSAVMNWLGSAKRNEALESSEDDEIPVAKSLKIPPPPPPTQKIQPSESKVHGRSAATKPSAQLDKDGEWA